MSKLGARLGVVVAALVVAAGTAGLATGAVRGAGSAPPKKGAKTAKTAHTSRAAGFAVRQITSPGPLTKITITDDLSCGVRHSAFPHEVFYDDPIDSDSDGAACGTFVATGGSYWGPAVIPANGYVTNAFTPISQTGPTGTGTSTDPYKITTVAGVGSTGLRVIEIDSYIVGHNEYRTDVILQNTTAQAKTAVVYRAGDCFTSAGDATPGGDADSGFGAVTSSGGVACRSAKSDGQGGYVPDNKYWYWLPLTAGSKYYESDYDSVWAAIDTMAPFPNTCDCATWEDNGAGLSWTLNVAAGSPSAPSYAYASHLTSISPDGALPETCGGLAPTIVGTNAGETLNGTSGNDVIVGLGGNDTINGMGGNDKICGGDGNDILLGGAGNDLVVGGAGNDIAGFWGSPTGVNANLSTGTATGEGSDTLQSIEFLIGSNFADTLTGNNSLNFLMGLGGADQLIGLDGPDIMRGGAGNDTLNGGNGLDTADYSTVTAAMNVNLLAGTATGEGTDSLVGVENATGGSGADTISGTNGPNVLKGSAGNDHLSGLAGADNLDGGPGTDTLDGGADTDVCTTGETVTNCP